MSYAHIASSVVIAAASVFAGIWLTRKFGPKFVPALKQEVPSFLDAVKTAKDDVSEKVSDGSRNLADVLLDVERKRSDDSAGGPK